jgi:Mg2+-importing ATPase
MRFPFETERRRPDPGVATASAAGNRMAFPSLAQLASLDASAALRDLASGEDGLTSAEAERRLHLYGLNEVNAEARSIWTIARGQLRSGINILLAVAAVLTIVTGDLVDGVIILTLIAVNVGLSILQEYRAELALKELRAMLPLQARVRRGGGEAQVAVAGVAPGDVVLLRSGDVVPADLRLLESDGLEINQATLTGESVPQRKSTAAVASEQVTDWRDIAFAGTTVVGGQGCGVVVETGGRTQFGETASLVKGMRAPGDFEVNLNHFGGFLLRFGLLLAAVVVLSNALLGRNLLVSLTLALAVALGIVPEALPAVTATSLALGASHLARKKVLVRRLAAVEDLSAIDTLCIDKTGTITENRTALTELWSLVPRRDVLAAAVLASSYPAQGASIIDDAIVAAAGAEFDLANLAVIERRILTPFSGDTKRMTVLVDAEGKCEVTCKGAAAAVLGLCTSIRTPAGVEPLEAHREEVEEAIRRLQAAGSRVLAVAVRTAAGGGEVEESGMTLLGLLGLSDPPRPAATAALRGAAGLGLNVKIVTGDALARAAALANQIQLDISPGEVFAASALHGRGLRAIAERGRIFAEVVPADKHHLVTVLQALGYHVAVTGDGVNDAPALQAAEVGIALASGTDATKGAADLILVEDDLAVIVDGIQEGRRTFTNINRYLLYTMVSNFANVIIVAIASLFLSYLPLLPAQVLLLNVLADLPMLTIVSDKVEADDLATPRRWNILRLGQVSLVLGLVNAVFAFALLRLLREQDPVVVHTSWFLFLAITALLILFAVRTSRWFWSRPWPSRPLLAALAAAMIVTVGLINLPITQRLLGFTQLDWRAQLGIAAYSLVYLFVGSVLIRSFGRWHWHAPGSRATRAVSH